jgi:plastocyanin
MQIKRAIIGCLSVACFGLSTGPVLGKDRNTVTIESFRYSPAKITIKRGESITFVNNDAAPHTVSPEKEGDFNSTGRLLQGDAKVVEFDKPGEFNYYCNFHPSMKGEVKVLP